MGEDKAALFSSRSIAHLRVDFHGAFPRVGFIVTSLWLEVRRWCASTTSGTGNQWIKEGKQSLAAIASLPTRPGYG